MASTFYPSAPRLAGLSRNFLVVGLIGLAATLAGLFVARDQFFRSWLVAFLFWGGLGLGCLGVLLLHSVVGGNWGVAVRRLLESGARTLPLVGILFVPILFGLGSLYIWARPEVVAADELLRHKAAYLNVPFMAGRNIAFFVVWALMALGISRLSLAQDRENSSATARRLRGVSGPLIILHVLMLTFASVDWIMSLEPHWFSTIFGALTLVGQVLSAIGFLTLVNIWLGGERLAADSGARGTVYDLGNLLLAFVMFWAYLAFSQFLIIYAGNLPEEIPWYLRRMTGGWQIVGLAVIFLHFMFPFMMLISRPTKRNPRLLAAVALLVVVMRLVENFYVVSPAGEMAGVFRIHWLDIAAPVGIGGVWLAWFFNELKGRGEVPGVNHLAEEASHGRS